VEVLLACLVVHVRVSLLLTYCTSQPNDLIGFVDVGLGADEGATMMMLLCCSLGLLYCVCCRVHFAVG
jgi:hypothetical protein